MEVTRENFLEVFPKIESAVKECDFIGIDGEFTGLGAGLPGKVLFDTPAQRYKRLKQGLSNHIIIQYGICTFKWNPDTKSYEAKPFNIYVFPRPLKGREVYFQCQSSSIDFLASQGFDFNKLFYKGLSYLNPIQEEQLRNKMESFHGNNNDKTPKSKQAGQDDSKMKSPLFIPPAMKSFVDDVCLQVEAFASNEEEKILNLEHATSRFKRKLVYEAIEERYQSKFYVETAENDKGEKYIRVIKCDEDERKRMKAECDAAKMAEFETNVGFLKIAKLLSESRKLIIGHNMLLDLMLTVNQFFAPLPETYDEFKQLLMTLFPKLLDTKLLATSKPLNEKISIHSLGGLYQFLGENFDGSDVVFSEGFDNYRDGTDKFHEAGYDAYCTGVCFASMASYLCKMQKPTEEKLPVDLDADLVKPFINRIYVMRINGLSYLTIDGPDDIPERKNVFHLAFPSDWNYPKITKLFNEFGSIFIALLDETSAFVALDDQIHVESVIQKFIVQKESGACKVITYRQHIGLDPLDMYDAVEEKNGESGSDGMGQSDEMEQRNEEDRRKNSKKRTADESLEEGEVGDKLTSNERAETVVKKAKKPKRAGTTISSAKDFYEPDDW